MKSSAKPKGTKSKREQTPGLAQRVLYAKITKILSVCLAPFLILETFFFSEVLSKSNYLEIFPREFIFPTVMHLVTALILGIIVYVIKKPSLLAGKLAASTLLGLLMVNYEDRLGYIADIYRGFLPLLPPKENDGDLVIISIIFLVTLFLLAILVGRGLEYLVRKYPQLGPNNIALGIFIFIGVLFVSQAVTIMQILPPLIAQSQPNAPRLPKTSYEIPQEKPDIYYIVLDRYTNKQVLQNQFGYDNSPFLNSLHDQGFYVRDDARSNYPYTAMSVSSTLSAGYTQQSSEPFKHDSVQSRTLYHELIYQSSVIKALKDVGYEFHNVGSTYGATNKAPLANVDHSIEHGLFFSGKEVKRLRNIEAVQFTQSPFYRFTKINASWWPIVLFQKEASGYIEQQLTTLDDLAAKGPGNRFIFSHILVPHDPFYFNPDGSLTDNINSDNIGKPVKQKYTEQIQFINGKMNTLIEKIKQKDKNAVIILNSDEGPYPIYLTHASTDILDSAIVDENAFRGDMRKWPEEWLQMKFGVLQAVHIPQATDEDLRALSSVNVFRIVLNRYLGYTLPYLPECHYALHKGGQAEFNYVSTTALFHGVEHPDCRKLENP